MRLNPIAPSLPNYPGPYKVGTIQAEIALPKELHKTFGNATVKTLLVRLFYPTSVTSGPRPRWAGGDHWAIKGYSTFLGISERALKAASFLGLRWTEIPAFTDAPLLPKSSPSRWPAMVFSHGLGGTRNAYSQVSGSIASGGLVVMAVEHRDNSAAISIIHEDGKPEEVVEYIALKVLNDAAVEKRRNQIAQRAYEVKLCVELFRAMNTQSSTIFPSSVLPTPLMQFKESLDTQPGRFIIGGHSFGAATAVHCAKDSTTRLPLDPTPYSFRDEFQACILLDPWMEVLIDSTSRKLNIPALAVASEAFYKWSTNWRSVVELMSHQERNRLCHIRNSAHLSQSDFQLLFPTATKYAFKAGISPHLAMDLNVRAIRQFLREVTDIDTPGSEDEVFTKESELIIFDANA